MQPLWLFYIIGIFTILIREIISKEVDAMIMIFGFFIIVGCLILDILTSQNIINLPTMITYGFIFFVLSIAIILANRFVRVHEQVEHLNIDLTKTNTAYQRFVPQQFLSFLGHKHIADVQIGDQVQKVMTVLFSDIRSFTTLSETMTPQENFNFLNSYLRHQTPLVQNNKGFIDKYIGDAVMALFPESAADALKAAIEMQIDVTNKNIKRVAKGYLPIKIGIGLHTGKLMLGTIGAENRMEGTVISDAVNLASRIEGLTKMFGANIAISHECLIKVKDYENNIQYRSLGKMKVKGKNAPVLIYEIIDGSADDVFKIKVETKLDFNRAIKLFEEKKYSQAVEFFNKVLRAFPDDKASILYKNRCEKILNMKGEIEETQLI